MACASSSSRRTARCAKLSLMPRSRAFPYRLMDIDATINLAAIPSVAVAERLAHSPWQAALIATGMLSVSLGSLLKRSSRVGTPYRYVVAYNEKLFR
jgi:hypothetical protein